MALTVKRFGGIFPTPKEKSFAMQDLDEPTRLALDTLLSGARSKNPSQPVPDGFTYKFELTEAHAASREAAVSGGDIPNALRKLLP